MRPRSLADALRGRDDDALGRLLAARPDLVHPVPSDFTALAARATTGPSVSRCLDALSAVDLFILGVAAREDETTPARIRAQVQEALPGITAKEVTAAVDRLVDLALLWGTATELRAIHPVRDAAPEFPLPTWPVPQLTWSSIADVDAQGGVHAHEAIAHVRDLCDAWASTPPGVLRSGGLAIRDLAQTVRALNTDLVTAAISIEVATAAGLIADDEEEEPAYLPTDAYDTWLDSGGGRQWIALARAWLTMPRLPALTTERTNLLSAELDRRAVVALRRSVLALLAEAPAGAMVDAASARSVLDARVPRRAGALRDQVVEATFTEAGALGLLVGGALTSAGRLLIEGEEKGAEHAMATAMPAEIDHVLLQADLTMIAPGPVTPGVARTLRLVADVESRGHATVYRISESSLQRAIDAGWDAARITRELAQVSRTGVPQPLAYLIEDTARRHGAVRVGLATSYVRCDNPATIAAILNDRRMRTLDLTRISEEVLVSQAPSGELIAALRAGGYAPAAEAPDGSVVVREPRLRRAARPKHRRVTTSRPDSALVTATVRGLRSGERASRMPRDSVTVGPAGSGGVVPTSSAATVAALKSAIADTVPVWIAYADSDGTTTEQIVDPIRLGSGSLTAFDHRTEQVRTFAVARISGVAPLAESSS